MPDWRLDGTAALLIGLGSALGGFSRVLVGAQFAELPELGTALVNVSGALLMGLLHVVTLPAGRWPMPVGLRQALLAGFLGGFTTFSILSMETLMLLQAGQLPAATLNLFGSLGLALLAVAAGHALGERLNG
ncbi:MAG: CrcB family protein [Gammaproteobacteria bacterium]|nr:CrcB family protein [Gammaproteobacteria bacterium]